MAKSILIVEWMMGGGQFLDSDFHGDSSLAVEGREMLSAVVADFMACGYEAIVPIDWRIESSMVTDARLVKVDSGHQFHLALQKWSASADAILLIAPESGGRLLGLCNELIHQAEKFLSPDATFVALTADKTETVTRLNSHGVRVAFGDRLDRWLGHSLRSQFPLPAILKPNDGAGSEGNQRIEDWSESQQKITLPEQWRLEQWLEGRPASISVLCNRRNSILLPPTFQILDSGKWVGCKTVQDIPLVRRAERLAESTVAALPSTRGYIGIDFLFGESESEDVVIEINPRLTSSYLHLRECVSSNLAAKMLESLP